MSEKDQKPRIILTYGRSLMALTAAHSLGSRGAEIIGCDDVDLTVLKFSKYCSEYFVHPEAGKDPDKFIDYIVEQVKKFKPEDDRPYILMPMFRDSAIFAEYEDRLSPYITVAVPDKSAINAVVKKDSFCKTISQHDILIPDTYILQTENDLAELPVDKISFPILLKTPDSQGGRGIDKVKDFEELERRWKESHKKHGDAPVAQQMIEGRDECFTALCRHGEIVASMAYKNVYQFPRKTGAGIVRETIDNKPFMKSAEKIVHALDWHGLIQIDYRWDQEKHSEPYMIEINPRYWAGLFHSVQSGIDYPWLYYLMLTGQELPEDLEAEVGKKSKIPGIWALSAVQDLMESETDWKETKKAWADMWSRENNETWRERWQHFTDSFETSLKGSERRMSYQKMAECAKMAVNEMDFDEHDPLTGLGFMFVLSSLMKHGKLPPELQF